jgi:DNA-binding response OmpR family regulator
MVRAKVLVVEDEAPTQALYKDFLESAPCKDEFALSFVSTGEAALRYLEENQAELIILDWTLPGISGLETLARIRQKYRLALIIMATAHVDEKDIDAALENGADDYLTKPFPMPLFLARLHALKRRRELDLGNQAVYALGDLRVDAQNGVIFNSGSRIELSGKERDLLTLFLRRPNMVHSAGNLMEALWGHSMDGRNILERHVSSLRKKLGPKWGGRLKSKYGIGYCLEIPSLEASDD